MNDCHLNNDVISRNEVIVFVETLHCQWHEIPSCGVAITHAQLNMHRTTSPIGPGFPGFLLTTFWSISYQNRIYICVVQKFMGNGSTSKSLVISLILIAFFSQLPKTCRMCIIDYFCLNNCSTMISGHGSQIKFCFLQNHQTHFFPQMVHFRWETPRSYRVLDFFKCAKFWPIL